ncbi:unnamed protein product [Pieris brassicae]|uniref:RNA-directed DNA polymerase n=1 Tax=Pieris brassicae TaxID=7116 RepID=A0A9P0TB94_PIEBR|nr:unnamed protein product [Pieris brassicae]
MTGSAATVPSVVKRVNTCDVRPVTGIITQFGLSVYITSDKLTIVENPSQVNICSVNSAAVDFREVDTDLPDDLKPQLLIILNIFRDSFVEGTPSNRVKTVVTDCNSLKASRTKVDLTPKVHRWWAFLQAFDFDIQYREGRRIAHVDFFFSRNHIPETNNLATPCSVSSKENNVVEKRVNIAELYSNWLQSEQRRDPECHEIIGKIESDDLDLENCKIYEMRSNVLYRKIQRNNRNIWLPIVPRAFRWSVINHIHESILHLGWDKTLDQVYQHYWFPNMAKYVRKFVEICITLDDHEIEIDIEEVRKQADRLIKTNFFLDKARFDKNKAKVTSFSVGDYVLIENHERNETKLDAKYKGPFEVIEVLDGDRYHLKSLSCNHTYKYARDRLRPIPQSYVPTELDPCLSDDCDVYRNFVNVKGEVAIESELVRGELANNRKPIQGEVASESKLVKVEVASENTDDARPSTSHEGV